MIFLVVVVVKGSMQECVFSTQAFQAESLICNTEAENVQM